MLAFRLSFVSSWRMRLDRAELGRVVQRSSSQIYRSRRTHFGLPCSVTSHSRSRERRKSGLVCCLIQPWSPSTCQVWAVDFLSVINVPGELGWSKHGELIKPSDAVDRKHIPRSWISPRIHIAQVSSSITKGSPQLCHASWPLESWTLS